MEGAHGGKGQLELSTGKRLISHALGSAIRPPEHPNDDQSMRGVLYAVPMEVTLEELDNL